MDEIRRTAVRLSRSEITQPLTDIDAIPSESDSSDEMEVFTPDADGMIRLEELGTQQPEGANLTLAIGIKKMNYLVSMVCIGNHLSYLKHVFVLVNVLFSCYECGKRQERWVL